jgi:transposase-like protein
MKFERCRALKAEPYERTEQREGHANGYKPKTVNTRFGRIILDIPQVRGMEFYPQCIEKGERSERALKAALAQMYISGVSTRRVKDITEVLCGYEVSSTQVSQVTKVLDAEFEKFRNRPLGEIRFLSVDAKYEKVRVNNQVISQALLVAAGVNAIGFREVVGVAVKHSEAEVNWREFFLSLKERGVFGLELITSDDHPGLKQAMQSVFPNVSWQRCQFHFAQNAQHKASCKSQKKEIADDVREIFRQISLETAQQKVEQVVARWEKKNPNFASWLDNNISDCFAVYKFHPDLHSKLRTSNGMERLNREIARRNVIVGIFPNPDSLLRLATAVVIEIHELWATASQPYMYFNNHRWA